MANLLLNLVVHCTAGGKGPNMNERTELFIPDSKIILKVPEDQRNQ